MQTYDLDLSSKTTFKLLDFLPLLPPLERELPVRRSAFECLAISTLTLVSQSQSYEYQ